MLFGECHTFRDAVYLKLKSMLLMLFHDLQHFMFFVLWCLWSTRKLTVDTHLLLALPSGSFAGGFFCRFKKASSPGSPGTTEKEGWDTFEIRCNNPQGVGPLVVCWNSGDIFLGPWWMFFFPTSTLKWFNSIHFQIWYKHSELDDPIGVFSRFSGCCTGNSSAEFQDFSHEWGVCALKAFAKVWSKLQQMLNAFNNSWKFEVLQCLWFGSTPGTVANEGLYYTDSY